MIIGLTGGIGSGKSTILNVFSEFKTVAIFIADQEAKKLMNSSVEVKSKIIKEFGEEAYKNNKLDRKFIAQIVFKDKNKLAILNNLVHPAVAELFIEFSKENSHKDYIIYESAIIFEQNKDALFDYIIVVTAPTEIKIKRLISRDHTSIDEVIQRMNNQWNDEKKTLQANYVIMNIQMDESKRLVQEIHNSLIKKSS
jgi:dephospho-CoA kinase